MNSTSKELNLQDRSVQRDFSCLQSDWGATPYEKLLVIVSTSVCIKLYATIFRITHFVTVDKSQMTKHKTGIDTDYTEAPKRPWI